ncbi:hypothetical protein GOEFS_023_00100 [Gordonia effusa NBRC 100432]|uniref:Uncharacterized protein n=1 Tax=Gordonia effusa NBRC 100432 TaxID=1077974 RepID=H0QWU2_9ACTN|nr:hypothetical protein GOEFS_023_00100 [Gordonia effusa NBRC 100432]
MASRGRHGNRGTERQSDDREALAAGTNTGRDHLVGQRRNIKWPFAIRRRRGTGIVGSDESESFSPTVDQRAEVLAYSATGTVCQRDDRAVAIVDDVNVSEYFFDHMLWNHAETVSVDVGVKVKRGYLLEVCDADR